MSVPRAGGCVSRGARDNPAVRLSRRSAVETRENALTLAVRRAREEGGEIRDLTVSNPTDAALPYATDAVIEPLRDERGLTYHPEPLGAGEARRAVGEAMGVPSDRVMLTASTSEAYAMLLSVLCDPGDRVLAPEPSYPLLAHLARLSGVALTPYQLRWDGRWHVDGGTVARGHASGARAILAVSPNNPTGSVLDAEDLRILDRAGVPLVVDEVFASYPLEGEVGSAYAMDRARIVVGGLSKLAGLPQMKVGWILVGGDDATSGALLERLSIVGDAYLSVSTPAMLALPRWLEGRATVADAIRARTRKNLSVLRGLVSDASPITIPQVEAGWYACARVPRTRTDEAWALRLLEADGVLVQPGYLYDFHEDGWLVLSLLTPGETFAEGARRLVERVESEA